VLLAAARACAVSGLAAPVVAGFVKRDDAGRLYDHAIVITARQLDVADRDGQRQRGAVNRGVPARRGHPRADLLGGAPLLAAPAPGTNVLDIPAIPAKARRATPTRELPWDCTGPPSKDGGWNLMGSRPAPNSRPTRDEQAEPPGGSLFDDLPAPKPLSRVKQRLARSAAEIAEVVDPESTLVQHTVLCQTGLPYRDPGEQRRWQQSQGAVRLVIEAGQAFHPEHDDFVDVGLPFGPKPRLILAHLNAEAIRTRSPTVEVEGSLSAFVQRIGLYGDGRSILTVKDQLTRLTTAEIRLALAIPGTPAKQVQGHIVKGFELWMPKDAKRRVLWPSNVTLSADYFESLARHAVPLDQRAIAALSHSAMALDMYSWLSQRLHRVPADKAAFIPWTALKAQFGSHYSAMFKFRQVFGQTLRLVCTQYPAARVELDGRGMTLRNSPPPVKPRLHAPPRLALVSNT
jgi:hypothetical protein